MNIQDFSNGFTTLANSYVTTAAFGTENSGSSIVFNEHEKSLFLTKSQEELALSLYNGKNPYGEGFEQTEEMRRYLEVLIKEDKLNPITTTDGKPLGIESNSKFFTLPSDLWFITYESVILGEGKCTTHTTQDVFPVRQDEYHKIKRNPFRGANDRRALRFDLSDGIVEIVSKYTVSQYYLRYLRKLKPIILAKLDSEAAIEGETNPQGCELHEALHQKILEMAVVMALQSRGYSIRNDNENR